ncbi:MAG: response regulator, partial [Spirochaetales bacterium]|nr:response regulator [Spirochaetales bacterium]
DEVGRLIGVISGMQANLKGVADHAGKISRGDFSVELELRSEKDELTRALNEMTRSLAQLKTENSHRDWIKTGLNMVGQITTGEKALEELVNTLLFSLAEYTGAAVGALFLFDRETEVLNMAASYSYSKRKNLSQSFALGEGLVGQAGREKKVISIDKLPDGYLTVSSGLGDGAPASVIAVPLLLGTELKGVLELGNFSGWDGATRELFDSVGENIAVAVNSCQDRVVLQELLLSQQKQAVELKSQQEELRATNEELEEKTESLLLSETQLKTQQEELQTVNEELEEKTQYLEQQRDEINRKNADLESAKEAIGQKAKDLEVSSRYKSEFLANMSHELRTPLNSLLILAKDLCNNRGGRLNEEDIKSAEIIYNSGSELLRLINEVLDLSKIESGKIDLELESMSLEAFREEMLNQFEGTAREKSLGFRITIAPEAPPTLYTDRAKLMQIIRNLLSNGLKFTREGSVELLIAPEGGERLNFIVKDTGIGVSGDEKERIFEAFRQADGSTSREFGGTGLGLSISRELAGLLNGYIRLESTKGEGSTFTLSLPLAAERQEKEVPSGSNDSTVPVTEEPFASVLPPREGRFVEDDRDSLEEGDKAILIVEDDRNFASILCKMAREEGFKTLAAPTGEEGIVLVERLIPAAVILDVKLPGMSGLQVLDYMKKQQNTRHIPVHLISGDDRSEDAKGQGVIGFLQKPIEQEQMKELFGKLTAIINKKVKDLLIVEDDDKLRYAIEKLIGNHDVEKTSVATGREALNQLDSRPFDCMVLDLKLPDMAGKELLEEISRMDKFTPPPVIVYTGKEISYEEEFELRRYASSIIIKGVNSQERLLDETALFLHRMIKDLPRNQQQMISRIYDEESVFKEKNILIVDDDMRNVYALSRILEERGMTVFKASNGRKALDLMGEEDFKVDLILMDIMMPEMDGYETTREIRKDPRFGKLPILAVTAKAMKEDRRKCLEAGANDYMTKPIEEDRLLSLMRVWLYK